MFTHGRTGKVYHSVAEKLNYFSNRMSDKTLSEEQRQYAKRRVAELTAVTTRTYNKPRVIITDDKIFGNAIHKPRMCVAVKEDSKKRILVAPLTKVTSRQVIMDNNIDRQISNTSEGRNKWISRNDIYEDKYITPSLELTERDIAKITRLYNSKK